MSSSNMAFVLVPGSFSPASFFDPLVKVLSASPHSIPSANLTVVTLPSTQATATMSDDASRIASAITTLVDRGLDVVVAANSYGGFPATESLKHGTLTKSARAKQGLAGGVVALFYVAAFIPQVGQSVAAITGGFPGTDPIMDLAPMKSPEYAAAVFGDVSQEQAEKYFDQMLNHSRKSFEEDLTYAGWKDVPVYYLHTKNDKVVPPELQLTMIEKAKVQGAKIEVIETEFSHVPVLGKEKEVADMLVKVAKESQA